MNQLQKRYVLYSGQDKQMKGSAELETNSIHHFEDIHILHSASKLTDAKARTLRARAFVRPQTGARQ